jgi:excisionase family DNA binding protein
MRGRKPLNTMAQSLPHASAKALPPAAAGATRSRQGVRQPCSSRFPRGPEADRDNNKAAPSSDGYCGTFYAARLLGLSVATVQSMVERGDLQAWKTRGGHRRILVSSLRAYQATHGTQASSAPPDIRISVLVVDDDAATREMMREVLTRRKLPVDCTVTASAMEALIDIHNLRPDVLFTDLSMPGVDGLALLRTLRANPAFEQLVMVAITGLSPQDIEARGGLPPSTIVVEKPVNPAWLQGFVSALVTARTLQATAKG